MLFGAIAFVGAVSTAQASGQTATAEQVEDLQKQIRVLEKKLESVQQKTFLNTSAGYYADKGDVRTTGRSGVNERQHPQHLHRGRF